MFGIFGHIESVAEGLVLREMICKTEGVDGGVAVLDVTLTVAARYWFQIFNVRDDKRTL